MKTFGRGKTKAIVWTFVGCGMALTAALTPNERVAGQDLSVSIKVMTAPGIGVVDEHASAVIKIVDPTTTGGTTYATINALPFEGLFSTTVRHGTCTTQVDEQISLDSDQMLSFFATEDCGSRVRLGAD